MEPLTELTQLPEGLLDLPAERLHERLGGPTLIHLSGDLPEPLFVSVLLHGNEPVGWEAMQVILNRYEGGLPRTISLFIGAVDAAKEKVRRLNHRPDLNRVWRHHDGPDGVMAATVLAAMRERNPMAAVDLHNNTGLNPHYSVLGGANLSHVVLGVRFERRALLFEGIDTTVSSAFAPICPSVTCECGLPGERGGVDHAVDFIETLLTHDLAELPLPPVREVELYRTVATLKIDEGYPFGFGDEQGGLSLTQGLEKANFRSLQPGALFGRLPGVGASPLRAYDPKGNDVTDRWLTVNGAGNILLTRPATPSMLTSDVAVIRQDCLGYLMERIPYESLR